MKKILSLLLVCVFLATCSTGGGNTEEKQASSAGSGERTYRSNTKGNRPLPGSPLGFEMWTEGGNKNMLTWYGPEARGGAAFRAEWNNPKDFLGRIGYFYGNGGKKFTGYNDIFVDFEFERSGRETAGNFSYIGIYGWCKNPLVEFYIVEDWFGNKWQDDLGPMGIGTTQGDVVGRFTVDDGTYEIHKSIRKNKPSIIGNTTFPQYFSIRQNLRQSGTISVMEHFKKWEELGLNLGNMFEIKFLVEAGGGVGWLELSHLEFRQAE